jgi:hypothetical protein
MRQEAFVRCNCWDHDESQNNVVFVHGSKESENCNPAFKCHDMRKSLVCGNRLLRRGSRAQTGKASSTMTLKEQKTALRKQVAEELKKLDSEEIASQCRRCFPATRDSN